ncbi:MAG: hypothetical protein J6Y06_05750 [Bacteroidales bacterium]|nr:hypothetical protein [Bacteroidales bacterium]
MTAPFRFRTTATLGTLRGGTGAQRTVGSSAARRFGNGKGLSIIMKD